jgi:rhodanese-related sulfurtransferase
VTAAADLTKYAASARADEPVDLTKYATAPGVAGPDEPVDGTRHADPAGAPTASEAGSATAAGGSGDPGLTAYGRRTAPAATAYRPGQPDLTKYAEGTAPAATAGRTGPPDLTKYAGGTAPAETEGRAGPPDLTKYAEGGGSAGVMGRRGGADVTKSALTVDELLAGARAGLRRIGPLDAADAQRAGAVLVDIRPHAQRVREGEIPGTLVVERNVLEWRFDPTSDARLPITGYDVPVIVVCSEGYTSSLAAHALQQLGLRHATDLAGGFHAWQAAGLPTIPGGTPAIP